MMSIYRVTITVEDLNIRETYTVEALDPWKARTRAMGLYLMGGKVHPEFSGSFVTYTVEETAANA